MRTLAAKLTLAFLVVGLAGTALVAVLVSQRTRDEFDRFVLDRYQASAVESLADYYARTGGWNGLGDAMPRAMVRGRGGRDGARPQFVLLDASNQVVVGPPPFIQGQSLAAADLAQAVPIEVDGAVVGRVLFGRPAGRLDADAEASFLAHVNQAILLSALGAVAAALVLGAVLARTISRPVQALTAATYRVARGELGHTVEVRSDDELGELAASFNQMSTDLAEASRLRRQTTADIAHDLRTPVSVILGYTEGLVDGKFKGEPSLYRRLHDEAQHLTVLIDDLRTLTLADSGELTLQRQPTPPRALLDRAVATHRPLADARRITLAARAHEGLSMVDVDPERMAQVLGNLVANALRHTPPGGEVVLGATELAGDGKIIITVADNGEGIAADDLPHVFTRHYRADKARGQAEGASGLGLAIAKSLVEAHGGTISVESTLGAGTAVAIRLPAGRAVAERPPE